MAKNAAELLHPVRETTPSLARTGVAPLRGAEKLNPSPPKARMISELPLQNMPPEWGYRFRATYIKGKTQSMRSECERLRRA